MDKGRVTETMNSNRILAHGKIATLPFKLDGGNSFSIFIIPKVDADLPILVNCRLHQDDTASNCPFNLKTWTEPVISEISTGGVVLANFDIYWGAGADANES